MNLDFTSLYIRDNKGAIREWSIGCEDGDIVIRYGQLNGSMQTQIESVPRGKAGRSLEEQIMSRISSRIHKRRDMGYSPNIEDARNKPVNALGLFKPMLAQPIKNIKTVDFSKAYYQNKYDGNRMLIANTGEGIIAYSRNGKEIITLDHIVDNIEMPIGTILDGEIYCHGESLQTIVSWAKRKQENTSRLRYHAYDLISDAPYSERIAMLRDVSYGQSAEFVGAIEVRDMIEVNRLFRLSRNQGYEGGILRVGPQGYEDGKRSKSLIKIKEWLDAEYTVLGITASADNWAVLACETSDGKRFTVSAPGGMDQKKHVLDNPSQYLGKKVNIEYSQITKDGIPFHPIATRFRNESDE